MEFDIETEASDAEVTWYQGNKKIVPDGERIIAVAEVNDPFQSDFIKEFELHFKNFILHF